MSTSIEDNELPKAILTRIMKQVLPENTNIQANARLAITKSTTLFINYLASAANEVATSAGHKIVSGAHVLKALESLDMEDMAPRLSEELKAFQAIQKSRKEGATKPSKDKDDSSTVPTSKKRKPTMEESNTNAKARKSSTGANPRDGQDITSGSLEEDIDEDEDAELEDKDEGDDDNEEDEDEDAEAVEENGTDSLNMDDEEHDDEEGKASNLDDEDDSDGF